jgi:hypothetical protein
MYLICFSFYSAFFVLFVVFSSYWLGGFHGEFGKISIPFGFLFLFFLFEFPPFLIWLECYGYRIN